jgi:uncharacterized protein (TIGR02284 family)
MRQLLMLSAALTALTLGACAQMKTAAKADAYARAQLQTNPVIASETNNLNHLTRVAIDATRLYDEAADEADDADLQTQLRSISAQRKTFAQNLQQRVAELGGDPAETGEATGVIHRSFTALRALVENDSVAAADEVYRGEGYIIDELDKALKTNLTPVSRQMVQTELTRVKAQRSQVEKVKSRIETRLIGEAAREDAASQAAKAEAAQSARPGPT